MNHQLACVNIHWLNSPAKDGQYDFYIKRLSKHILNDVNSIRTIRRTMKNILNYGRDARLRTLCEVLDAYRENIINESEAATSERDQICEIQTQSRKEQQRKKKLKQGGFSQSDKVDNDIAYRLYRLVDIDKLIDKIPNLPRLSIYF
jgi:hypothetical protein